MRLYISISTLMFLLIGLQLMWCISYPDRFAEVSPDVMEGMLLGWSIGCFVLSFFGGILMFVWSHRKSKLAKEREEISDLIMILKRGREEQLAVINELRARVVQEQTIESTSEE